MTLSIQSLVEGGRRSWGEKTGRSVRREVCLLAVGEVRCEAIADSVCPGVYILLQLWVGVGRAG